MIGNKTDKKPKFLFNKVLVLHIFLVVIESATLTYTTLHGISQININYKIGMILSVLGNKNRNKHQKLLSNMIVLKKHLSRSLFSCYHIRMSMLMVYFWMGRILVPYDLL